jgi:hypothetical protein
LFAVIGLCGTSVWAQTEGAPKPVANPSTLVQDPFAGLDPSKAQASSETVSGSWLKTFFTDNFGFRKEIMSQFDTSEHGQPASRQSVGFEVLKKFSTGTATVAAFDFQGRLVRRDGFNSVPNDMEGESRQGWAFEYHNLYVDLYNVLNPFLSDSQRGQNVGRFNIRAGRFYVPFGLNLQTDTHGTVLQLSNARNFGFERDWYGGFWGSINSHLNYDAYYLTGSGYDLKFKGQSGLGALRLSLANKYRAEYGLEAGLSILGGERLSAASDSPPIRTRRAGLDGRYRRPAGNGLLTFTSEFSGGQDMHDYVFSHLHEAEYLHRSRRWGVAAQFRRFNHEGAGSDASIIGELSWYFRNDVGNSNVHWIKLNVERQLDRIKGPPATIVTLQYYFYR